MAEDKKRKLGVIPAEVEAIPEAKEEVMNFDSFLAVKALPIAIQHRMEIFMNGNAEGEKTLSEWNEIHFATMNRITG